MRHRPIARPWLLAVALALGAGPLASLGAAAQDATPRASPVASPVAPLAIPLFGVDGAEVGSASFEEGSDGVTIAVSVEGLEPGEHGFHLHAMGMCDPSGEEPFATAGPHWNPTGAMHGAAADPTAHAGDFGNLVADADGATALEVTTDRYTLGDGPTSVFDEDGTALIVHLGQDDLVSQPAGDSGGRYACGVVAEPMTAAAESPPPPITGNVVNPEQTPFGDDLLAGLELPDGFEISVFARGLTTPRMMAVGPDGTVYLSQTGANTVRALRDTDADGVVDDSDVVASNLPYVHGLAIRDGRLYLAGENRVWVADLQADGALGEPQVLIDDLPDGDQHPRHTLAFGPDGMLYVSIGSSCNACQETNPENATLLRANPDGSGREIFAKGLRNTIGWGWHPATGELWGMDMGTDWMGDDQPPEELNRLVEGANYGWPYCYADRQVTPYLSSDPPGATADQYCDTTEGSVLTYQAHSSPIGMVFYKGDQFPADYQGDAFVAMRGSWNRAPAVGYKVVHVRFEDGQPVAFDDFATGWLLDDGAAHFGRLAGLAVAPDGALLLSEDTNGVVYRIAYTGG